MDPYGGQNPRQYPGGQNPGGPYQQGGGRQYPQQAGGYGGAGYGSPGYGGAGQGPQGYGGPGYPQPTYPRPGGMPPQQPPLPPRPPGGGRTGLKVGLAAVAVILLVAAAVGLGFLFRSSGDTQNASPVTFSAAPSTTTAPTRAPHDRRHRSRHESDGLLTTTPPSGGTTVSGASVPLKLSAAVRHRRRPHLGRDRHVGPTGFDAAVGLAGHGADRRHDDDAGHRNRHGNVLDLGER